MEYALGTPLDAQTAEIGVGVTYVSRFTCTCSFDTFVDICIIVNTCGSSSYSSRSMFEIVECREAITSLASSYLIMSPPTLGRHECSSCDYLGEKSFSDFHFDSDSEPTSRLALSPSLV